jgi:hypothetical protein
MTNSDWWDGTARSCPHAATDRDPQARDDLRTTQGEHEIVLEKRPVFGVGEELILSVTAGWRWMRVFRPQGPMLSNGRRRDGDAARGAGLECATRTTRALVGFHRNQMAATNAAATNMTAPRTCIHQGGGNRVTCRPRPHAMAKSHLYALLPCALALPASLLREAFLTTFAATPSRR